MAVGRSASRGARGGISARLRTPTRAPRAEEGKRESIDDQGRRAVDGKRSPSQASVRRFKQMSQVAAASVAVALLSVGFGLWQAASGQAAADQATRGARAVVVTQRDVSAGELLDEGAVTLKDVPAEYRQESVFDAAFLADSSASGARALVDIPANTQLSAGLVAGGSSAGRLSAQLAQGMEAVSLSVDDESGIAGQVEPYDVVRIVSVQQATGVPASLDVICAAARVLSTGGDGAGEGISYSAITVEVTPDEADGIRLAQATGSLSVQLACADGLSGR